MAISVLNLDDQSWVADYNRDQSMQNVIPLLYRNQDTGWPLLQVSLFYAKSSGEQETYENVLGGGKCHAINQAMFNFAGILSQIPGKKEILSASGLRHQLKPLAEEKFNVYHIEHLLHGFEILFKHLGIKITHKQGSYGTIDQISFHNDEDFSDLDVETLNTAIRSSFEYAMREQYHRMVFDFGNYQSFEGYTLEQIENELNKDVAIFMQGQIWIDLGMFLNHFHVSEPMIQYFSDLFKVNQILSLKPQSTPVLEFPQELRASIQKLTAYADRLSEEPEKCLVTRKLAEELQHKIDDFYSKWSKKAVTKGDYDLLLKECEIILHQNDRLFTGKASYIIMINNVLSAIKKTFLENEKPMPAAAAALGMFKREEKTDKTHSKHPTNPYPSGNKMG